MKSTNESHVINVAIYTRVSTTEQELEGISLENQEERCKAKAQQMFPDKELVFTTYTDPGYSGSLWYRKEDSKKRGYRPALTRMLEAIADERHCVLVTYRNDRLARSLPLWVDLLDNSFIKHGIDLICVNGPERPLSIEGRLTSNILASISEHYRSLASENVSDVLRHRRANGYYVGDVAYGWMWTTIDSNGSSITRNIKAVPDQGKWIMKMADMFLDGHSYEAINRMLKENGVKSPSGKDVWHTSAIRGVISNPVHAGLIISDKGELIEGKHSAEHYYDADYYKLIQSEIQRRKLIAPRTKTEKSDIVLGKAICSHCGDRLYVDQRHNSRHTIYYCRNNTPKYGKSCRGVRARIDRVDHIITKVIGDLSKSNYLNAEAEKIIEKTQSVESGELKQKKAHLERLQRDDRDKLVEATDKLVSGDLREETFRNYETAVTARNAERQKEIDEIDRKLGGLDNQSAQIEQMKKVLHDFPTVWAELSIDEKRKLIDLLINEISLEKTRHGSKLTIRPIFADPIIVTVPAAKRRTGDGTTDPWNLSDRELSILSLLNDGLNPREVAERIGISKQQVHNTTTTIRQRFSENDINVVINIARPVIEEKADFLPIDKKIIEGRKGDDTPTEAQMQILQLLSQGKSKPGVARELGITVEAVYSRLRVLRNKLGLEDYAELMKYACDKGWIDNLPEKQAKTLRPLLDENDVAAYFARVENGTVDATAKALEMSRGTLAWRYSQMFARNGVKTWNEFTAKMQEPQLAAYLERPSERN